jgi:membrane peptidoglycan carboxypeptidase
MLILRLAAVAIAIALVSGYAVTAYAQSVFDDLPNIKGYSSATLSGDTRIYDSSGTTLLADVGDKGDRRVNATLDDISPKLIQATVAIEDRTFWTNPGFDPQGIARAGVGLVRHRAVVGGGSTITQQLAKQMFLTPQQTLDRKVKELALAYELTKSYSKRQILQLYLNKNPYGEQQFGIEAASETYFHRSAKDLDLAQAAMLAGIPQSPSHWDPVLHFNDAKFRQGQVLEAMVHEGYVTSAQSRAAFKQPLQVFPPATNYQVPHFIYHVLDELEQLGFHPGQEQLAVKTTLDWGRQLIAQQAVQSNLAQQVGKDPGGKLSSAMTALDPKTGAILTYVGSPDYADPDGGTIDFVGGQPVNPGSSVKPFTYASAIESKIATMDTPIADVGSPPPAPPDTYVIPQPGGERYPVQNFDKHSHGTQPLRKALASSLNIPAVKVEMAMGVPAVVDFMRRLGLKPFAWVDDGGGKGHWSADEPESSYKASLTLGGFPVSLLDEAAGYATFANMGVYHKPYSVASVSDVTGKPLYQADPAKSAKQVLDPGVSFIISSIISNDANRTLSFNPGSPLNLTGRKAAAKTGTTDNFKDALTAGYTPDLVSIFWVGDIYDTNHHMQGPFTDGVYVAAPAWHDFMSRALESTPASWYNPPDDVTQAADGSWFLKDATKVQPLPNDSTQPSPSPDAAAAAVAGNPNAAPVEVGGGSFPGTPGNGRRPRPDPTFDPFATPSPTDGFPWNTG